jgi:hypothetical protein
MNDNLSDESIPETDSSQLAPTDEDEYEDDDDVLDDAQQPV